jgi:signal transduction histidine kinase
MEVAIDITERKQQEQFREQYVGLISHDLRAPISAIALAATLLKALLDRGASLAETARPLETIRRSARRMADMIEELLETTRLESGHLRLRKSGFDLGRLAESVVAQFQTTAAHPIRCHASGAAPVLADEARVERVLENLIGNALRYSPPESPIAVHIDAQDQEAIVTVLDAGIGIPPEELPKLFQRFYRVKGGAADKGLGLGLYNSRLIIEHHGGRIWAESSAGAGSKFGFALPLTPPAAAASR